MKTSIATLDDILAADPDGSIFLLLVDLGADLGFLPSRLNGPMTEVA